MGRIGAVVGQQIRKSSLSQQNSIVNGKSENQISPTEHAALFTVINKVRLLNGWTSRTAKELDPTIRVWFEALSGYAIPISAYNDLYKRALDVRQSKLQNGNKDVPQIDATLLIAQWEGPHGLKSELRLREIAAGRTLTAQAASQCTKCFGTGMEYF